MIAPRMYKKRASFVELNKNETSTTEELPVIKAEIKDSRCDYHEPTRRWAVSEDIIHVKSVRDNY